MCTIFSSFIHDVQYLTLLFMKQTAIQYLCACGIHDMQYLTLLFMKQAAIQYLCAVFVDHFWFIIFENKSKFPYLLEQSDDIGRFVAVTA